LGRAFGPSLSAFWTNHSAGDGCSRGTARSEHSPVKKGGGALQVARQGRRGATKNGRPGDAGGEVVDKKFAGGGTEIEGSSLIHNNNNQKKQECDSGATGVKSEKRRNSKKRGDITGRHPVRNRKRNDCL